MKKKSILITLLLVVALSILIVCYLCSVVAPTEKFMAKISFRDKVIEVRLVQAGATTRDVIQIISNSKNKQQQIIKNIENNNFLLGYSIMNDSTLKIVVNKVGQFVNKPDTIEVLIPR